MSRKFIILAALLCISNTALAEPIILRDWVDTKFNNCLVEQTTLAAAAIGKSMMFLNQYTVKYRTGPYPIVDAEFLRTDNKSGGIEVYEVGLKAANGQVWKPYVEDNFYLGYQADEIEPTASMIELGTTTEATKVDLQPCISK